MVVPSFPDTIQSWGEKKDPIPLELVLSLVAVEDDFFNYLSHESSERLPKLVNDANPRVRAMAYLAYLRLLPKHYWLSVLEAGFADDAELTFSLDCSTFSATLGDVLLYTYLDSNAPFLGPLALHLLSLPDEFPTRTAYLRDQLPKWFSLKHGDLLREAAHAGEYSILAPLASLGNPADQKLIINALVHLQREPFNRDQAISVFRACKHLPDSEHLPHLLNLFELTREPHLDLELDFELLQALALHQEPVVQKLFEDLVSHRKSYFIQARLERAIPESAFDYFEETLQILLIDFDTTGAMNRFLWAQKPVLLLDALADWRQRNPHSTITIESLIERESLPIEATTDFPRSSRFWQSRRIFNKNHQPTD